MIVVRGRAEARFMPSRHHFALFRLIAFFRLRNARPEPRPVILVIDRDQNAIDHHATSIWLVLTLACYIAATLFASWPVPAALAVALLIAPAALHVPLFVSGLAIAPLVVRGENHVRVNSIVYMTQMLLAAAYFARWESWVRFAAWQFLAIAALNAVCAVIVFLLRGNIARLEEAVIGGAVSGR